MPSEKTARSAERRRVRNRGVRRATRTIVAGSLQTMEANGGAEPAVAVKEIQRALDKAVKKGLIHPNTAARKKSRISARATAIQQEMPKPQRKSSTKRASSKSSS